MGSEPTLPTFKDASPLRVGLIGLGAFGSKIALRLLWSKFPTLSLYDVVDMYTRQFTGNNGGMAVGSPKMLADSCDIVVTVLPSARELRHVCLGWESLAKGFSNGGIVLDLGQTDPFETASIGEELAAKGIYLVDAPAYGTPQQAREGKLTIIVGGADEAVARCQPLLEVLGQRIIRAGMNGSAQAAGMLADYQRAIELVAASEVFHLGSRIGLQPSALLEIGECLRGMKASPLVTDFLASRTDAGIPLGVMRKSVEEAGQIAERLGHTGGVIGAARAALAEAEATIGWGADVASLVRWLELRQPSETAAAQDQGPARAA
ncbi:MAG: NAD(P)-binding domain-containing protein [Bauldia sp.]